MPTQAQIDDLAYRLTYDTPFWAEQCAWIVNKQRQLQRLTPLPWQARTPETPADVVPLDEALEKQRAAGQPMRAIILKARKLGFSTWAQAKSVQRVTMLPFQSALTVAHRTDAAADLFDMGQLMYERLPSDEMLADMIYGEGTEKGPPFTVKPLKLSEGNSRSGIRFLEFGDRIRKAERSTYRTLTAGAKGGGRASTPNIIHASEYGHWEDPDYGIGLFNAMPLEPETIGIIESTANGFNHFAEMWDLAKRGSEHPEMGGFWIPLFYGWQHNPRNSVQFSNEAARERFERTVGDADGGGDPEEIELVEAYGVTLEQLLWRRGILNGPEAKGSIEWFHQEHPATPEQAFIGSGQPVFPGILVARAIREAERAPKPVQGILRGADWQERRTRAGTVQVPRRVLWVPGDHATDEDTQMWSGSERLLVWQHPLNEVTQSGLAELDRRPDGQYVVFADIAIGSGGTNVDGDWHAVQVLDHITRKQVARYRSRVPVHDLPLLLYMIALYYNTAWLAPEANGPGQSVIDALRADYGYPVLYRRHRAGDDSRQDTREYLLGWLTTLATKPLMEMTFGTALKEGTHGIRDVATAREASTYVSDPKRPQSHGAQKGAHDDLLMAMMGAHRVAEELAPRREGKKRRKGRWQVHDDLTGY